MIFVLDPANMFLVMFKHDAYERNSSVLDCEDLEIPLGDVVEINEKIYVPVAAVELLTKTPRYNKKTVIDHQVFINRKNVWYNVDNKQRKIFKMKYGPSMPTLVLYEDYGNISLHL